MDGQVARACGFAWTACAKGANSCGHRSLRAQSPACPQPRALETKGQPCRPLRCPLIVTVARCLQHKASAACNAWLKGFPFEPLTAKCANLGHLQQPSCYKTLCETHVSLIPLSCLRRARNSPMHHIKTSTCTFVRILHHIYIYIIYTALQPLSASRAFLLQRQCCCHDSRPRSPNPHPAAHPAAKQGQRFCLPLSWCHIPAPIHGSFQHPRICCARSPTFQESGRFFVILA